MALLTWNDKFSVGMRSIDDQHTILFEALNELHNAMMKGHAKNLTGRLLHNLLTYTRDHFTAEETMLAIAKYPALAQHRMKHRTLVKQVAGYVERLERGDISLNVHLVNFLRDWFTNHILQDDREYVSWLNGHGIQ